MKDIQSLFLEEFSAISVGELLTAVLLSFFLGLFIVAVYRVTYTGVLFQKSFALGLVLLSMVTSLVILTISSNVVLSLGMVGALSIVRFRAAIKEPMEIVFLFWSIAVGIVIGAGMIPLAVIGSAIIGVVLLLFANRKSRENPYILVLNCADEPAEQAALGLVKDAVSRYGVKTKTVSTDGIELTAELRTRNNDTAFVNRIIALPGVSNATLVSYNGEYMS